MKASAIKFALVLAVNFLTLLAIGITAAFVLGTVATLAKGASYDLGGARPVYQLAQLDAIKPPAGAAAPTAAAHTAVYTAPAAVLSLDLEASVTHSLTSGTDACADGSCAAAGIASRRGARLIHDAAGLPRRIVVGVVRRGRGVLRRMGSFRFGACRGGG